MPDVKHFDVTAALDAAVALFWRNGMAATGIQDITSATGLNRSSLYATFGNKQSLYVSALRRYIDTWATPALRHLTDSDRGLAAVTDFFDALIQLRCESSFAGWGCMITNANAGIEVRDPEIRGFLDRHHRQLRDAMRVALETARRREQVPADADLDAAADMLISLTYALNLRSRSDADAAALREIAARTITSIGRESGT
ncbi:TetR family transcriptional regulator [Mycobacterium saskatchewanense]|uniref:TetR family transcriptional regulator n=1 Tax=Mycobacterium saskatchewanense TaxID=220927 RepID=A0AAJ3TTD3_9MYCO|nr:TetR/AcrR family transcriptional regulator [Mycobacterium saskatchewanense]ORW67811.1 TetR family transcriptional regulator [Mycobacterium saskatchewanense]BBX60912.1 TetR family transcriptional regulator [Mycobacterium saskatchewanense]